LLDLLPVAVCLCDADGYIAGYNEAAVSLWGRRPEPGNELWCGSWRIYDLDGSPLPLDSSPMAETLKSGKPASRREIIIEQPDGTRINVLSHPHPLFDEKGVLIGGINVLVDVSAQ